MRDVLSNCTPYNLSKASSVEDTTNRFYLLIINYCAIFPFTVWYVIVDVGLPNLQYNSVYNVTLLIYFVLSLSVSIFTSNLLPVAFGSPN